MQPLEFYNKLYLEFSDLQQRQNAELIRSAADLGRRLKLAGFHAESDHCFHILVRCMEAFLKMGNVDAALVVEGMTYTAFVKTTETEEHYARCFSLWNAAFQAAGRARACDLTANRDPRKVCFVMQNVLLLGHTEVMLTTIDAWRDLGLDMDIYVAGFGTLHPSFMEQMDRRGLTYLPLKGEGGQNVSIGDGALLLRDRLEQLNVQTVVWLSVPTTASFVLAMRLAPRQVFWSVKFHPVFLPEVDVHLCGGHEMEVTREYNGNVWTVSPFPLALMYKPNPPEEVAGLRGQYPSDAVLLGSLAREEKFNSPSFLTTVGILLARNPKAHFLWTGRSQPEMVLSVFKQFGIADRCHFIGWVNSNLYAEVLDVFLETFPFGCGITGFQAMSHGTPLLSLQGTDTLYGYQLEGGVKARMRGREITHADFESLEILTAADQSHYLDLAQRLIDDPEYRRDIGAREKAYVQGERDALPRYAKRLWTNMTGLPA